MWIHWRARSFLNQNISSVNDLTNLNNWKSFLLEITPARLSKKMNKFQWISLCGSAFCCEVTMALFVHWRLALRLTMRRTMRLTKRTLQQSEKFQKRMPLKPHSSAFFAERLSMSIILVTVLTRRITLRGRIRFAPRKELNKNIWFLACTHGPERKCPPIRFLTSTRKKLFPLDLKGQFERNN